MNQTTTYQAPAGVKITTPYTTEIERVLTPGAIEFIAQFERTFRSRRRQLLSQRADRQREIDTGVLPDFSPATEDIRQAMWRIAPVPDDLLDRRVEITGPPDRKMVINALNSGANVYMADFEDSLSPTWTNIIEGQINLCAAVNRTLGFTTPDGKHYELNGRTATLMVRPRGWHLDEKHVLVDGSPISASLFDFGIFFFHNAKTLIANGSGPYFYLPKLENHLEAQLWNDVFIAAQDELEIPRGTIKATVLIETILAAYEMHEILYQLKDHSAGLNCGRWDYIFSVIKKFQQFPPLCLPDRASVTMSSRFLRSYSQLLIQTCHKRGAHAIGGMAAQIPIKNNPRANDEALAKVRADKAREAKEGHDGTWVAHPALVPIAKAIFDDQIPGPNQLYRKREDVLITAGDLLTLPEGEITETGFRTNIRVALQYLEAWLRGQGCVPLYNLMEDAATAEISRAQLWQWVHSKHARFADGRVITADLYRSITDEEMQQLYPTTGTQESVAEKFLLARQLLDRLVLGRSFTEFFTIVAYDYLD